MNTVLAMENEFAGPRTDPGRRVLIVDDDHDFADSLETLLGLEGYVTSVAYSAQGARAAIDDFDAQVAVLDYRLGQKTGVELASVLKRRRPGLVCILATAFADLDTAVEALREGIDDYFRKPLHAEELLITLERCFGKIRLEEEKRAAEEALREARKMEAVAQVAGGVAHHFNNLMMIVAGNMELLEDRLKGDPESMELAGKVVRASERAADITQGLLAYTRNQLIKPEPVDLTKLALETGSSLPAELTAGLQIQWHTAPEPWPVRIDREGFKRALECLIRNAAEAMPDGGRLTITTANRDPASEAPPDAGHMPPGRHVMVEVADTGAGMAPGVAERAFEPFFTGKGLAEYTGLGLSIVYGFAQQSGGQVTLESQEGRGTTVRLYLPAAGDDGD